jgi:iron(III) transport system permease protein
MLVDSALRTMDPALEEAATTTGASRLQVLRKVTLPLVAPTILTAMNLTAIHNLVVFGPPAVIGIPANIYVMASQIYVELATFPPRLEFTAALAVLFLAFAGLLLITQWTVTRRRSYATILGKGLRPRELPLNAWRWPIFALCLTITAIALFIPAAMLVVISLLKVWTSWLAPGNFTLSHYAVALFGDSRTVVSIANTLILAAVTVCTTLTVGLAIAFIAVKTRHPLRHLLGAVSFLPYSVPGTIFTVGVILAFIRPPFLLYGTLGILMACYFARFLPFAVQPLSAALRQVDSSLLEAGRVVGAGPGLILRRIMLPLLKFSVLSTVMLVFIACLREVVSAILLAAPGTETLMVSAFRLWEEGNVQETAALMVLLLVLVMVFFLLARRLVGDRMF